MATGAQNNAKPVRGKPFQKGADPRRKKMGAAANPNGRPPNESSVTYWMRQFAGMSPIQVAEYCEVFAKELRKRPGELPIAGVIAARILMQQMDEPQPGVLGHLLDRTDGPVKQQVEVSGEHQHRIEIVYVDDWRTEANQVAEAAFGTDGGSEIAGAV